MKEKRFLFSLYVAVSELFLLMWDSSLSFCPNFARLLLPPNFRLRHRKIPLGLFIFP
jgi:hypothetical protein